MSILAGAVVLGAFLGLFVSQYAPLFGGLEKFGAPWSEARMNLVVVHVITFMGAGFALGLYVVNSLKKSGT